ncbi:YqhA family protein [Methanoculleus sp. FWC-SCC1]|uniref:YqhA family protein n=1 Tax=Methanoculleus frigidifontis TaxID=2584085 RepID=A0ABT8MDC2_9EURY|nr:YqhA family protein [Methanoculleus sp. FWC-SCC1]MDN7025942.1 YqhA family protein [Methanoculleus sp. FWC-SCC1]
MEKVTTPDTPAPAALQRNAGTLERVFERILWNSRFIVLLGVIFGALSAVVLFIAGSLEIFTVLVEYLHVTESHLTHEDILIAIIGAVDFYLIGLVLLIFSFGIYELFISELDIARNHEGIGNILEVASLDDLKNKIIKVIIMVLIVSFFQRILTMEFTTSIDMLAMAISIGVICIGVYFLGRHNL